MLNVSLCFLMVSCQWLLMLNNADDAGEGDGGGGDVDGLLHTRCPPP